MIAERNRKRPKGEYHEEHRDLKYREILSLKYREIPFWIIQAIIEGFFEVDANGEIWNVQSIDIDLALNLISWKQDHANKLQEVPQKLEN